MKNTFKKEIEDFLFSKYDAKKSSDIWVNIKCPYCDANSSKRHFYVCMDDNRPMVYRCFRASCGARGVLNRKIARHLGIVSTHLLEFIDKEYLTNSKFIKILCICFYILYGFNVLYILVVLLFLSFNFVIGGHRGYILSTTTSQRPSAFSRRNSCTVRSMLQPAVCS